MPAITQAQLAEWRHSLLHESGGQFGDPTLSELIAPKLMDELERAWERLASAQRQLVACQAAILEERLAEASIRGCECPACHNAEARAALARMKKVAG